MRSWIMEMLGKGSWEKQALSQILVNQGVIMAQIDDLKAALAEVTASQDATAVALADLAQDVTKLVELVSTQPPPVDLTEVIASAVAIRDTAMALAAAATTTASVFDSSTA